jgi:hypothetical protein
VEPISEDAVFEEIRAAVEAGKAAGLPRVPVATVAAVQAVEEAIGCLLPPLLRRLFLEVANGGFGPGHSGILGAPGYRGWARGAGWEDLLQVHRDFRSGPGPQVPRHLLWLYDWGCKLPGDRVTELTTVAHPPLTMW